MSHNHSHGNGCSHEHHDHDEDHDHDHLSSSDANDNLFAFIDQPNVRILNSVQEAKIIKPWDQRMDETIFVESDADDQLIIRVPFTGSIKLRSILIKSGPGDQTPSRVALFPNQAQFDFEDASDMTPVQELTIVQSREVGNYAVKPAKFSNISSITLFFPSSQGADTIQIYYLGFLGTFTERNQAPTTIVYEAQANPADHTKVPRSDRMLCWNSRKTKIRAACNCTVGKES
ncbi:DUF1000-domain-containing protein [Hysterangium stoloniferum]|nr:DUF1000-domain-containing protein [Hysterangium stoloniferum]